MNNSCKKTWKKCLAVTALTAAGGVILALPITAFSADSSEDKPKNIIFIVGDGMGSALTTAYRNFMDDPATARVENTIFDQLLVGMASTYSYGTQADHNDNTYVTDSAAAATALSTGVKTYNQAVAQDVNDQPLQTIMEYAKSLGKTTGLVVTSQINHATPASYVAHNTYRYNYEEIADDFFDNRVNGQFVADLMFGGGQKYFIRKKGKHKRDLVAEFKQAGYQYYDHFKQLDQFDRLPALGLFAKKGMGYAIDHAAKDGQYRLQKMVAKALSLMDKGNKSDKGYFLLIEGSLIDWCAHNNDIACTMREIDDLAEVVRYLKDYMKTHPDTLMVMTADHNTGGMSIGANDVYRWKPELVKKMSQSVGVVAKRLLAHQYAKTVWDELVAMPITPTQLARLNAAQQQANTAITLAKTDDKKQLKTAQEAAKKQLEHTLAALIGEISLTGWTSLGHSGDDVQVFAHGKGKALFNGHQDNTDIAKKLFKLIK